MMNNKSFLIKNATNHLQTLSLSSLHSFTHTAHTVFDHYCTVIIMHL